MWQKQESLESTNTDSGSMNWSIEPWKWIGIEKSLKIERNKL